MDYTFLSKEEFLALEKSGDLLESGVYEGKRHLKVRKCALVGQLGMYSG